MSSSAINTNRLTASDFHSYYQPEECPLRVYLRHTGVEEGPDSPYEVIIKRLGEYHENTHVSTLTDVLDLSGLPRSIRNAKTQEAVAAGVPVIYQGALTTVATINGITCEIVGDPDYLIASDGNYIIRDSKISRRITEKDHPEILRQLWLYGWLYQQMFGMAPARLEIHSGTNDIIEVASAAEEIILSELGDLLKIKLMSSEPFSPVGYTKCGGCGFHNRCWPAAMERKDVALVNGVDQGLASVLHNSGVKTYHDLVEQFDEQKLSVLKRPWGQKQQKVGTRANGILQAALCMKTQEEILLVPPAIPDYPNYVMFDLEGLPPHLDEIEKIYLWGMQVFGESPSEFMAATGGAGEDGDRDCWNNFLDKANYIFEKYGNLPFIHWHHYEKTKVNLYIDRFGDRNGIAARVLQNLIDLFTITRNSIVLPLPSYSLKVIEKYIGYERSQVEYGGDWSMAKYIEATETANEEERVKLMDEILTYNREDLEATWAVFQWLKQKR